MGRSFLNCATGVASVVAVAAGVAVAPAPAAAAVELRLAHYLAPVHPQHRFLFEPWAKEVAEKSGGELTIRIYPGGELGAAADAQFKRAVDGIADITFGLPGYTSAIFPRTTLFDLPAMSRDGAECTDHMWQVFDPHLTAEWQRVKVLGLWCADSQILMTATKPIRAVTDLRGLKVRAPSRAQAEGIRALGAAPETMPAPRIYQSMQTGVIDGVIIAAGVIQSFRLAEVARYYTTGLPLGRATMFVAMNRRAYDALPPSAKKVIDDTTGLAFSQKGAAIYEAAAKRGFDLVRETGRHEVIALPPDEVARGAAALVKARDAAVDELERGGVPARAVLTAIGLD